MGTLQEGIYHDCSSCTPWSMATVFLQAADEASAAEVADALLELWWMFQRLKDGQDVVFNSLQARFNDVSAVNIDVEMANLLNLQNAYAANARVVSTVKEMIDALMTEHQAELLAAEDSA